MSRYQDETTPIKEAWWEIEETKDREERLTDITSGLASACSHRITRFITRKNWLFHDQEDSFSSVGGSYYSGANLYRKGRATLNVIKQVIGAALAKISKNKPRPVFTTTNGSDELKRKANKIKEAVSEQFNAKDFYKNAIEVFGDLLIGGTAGVWVLDKSYDNKSKSDIEFITIHPNEILIPESNYVDEKPDEVFFVKKININELLSNPDYTIETKDITLFDGDTAADSATPENYYENNLVEVTHCLALKKGTLHHSILQGEKEIYHKKSEKCSYMPIAWCRSGQRVGFWGESMYSQVYRIQVELSNLFARMMKSAKYTGSPFVTVLDTGNSAEKISNLEGQIYKYKNPMGEPKIHQPPPFNAVYFNAVEFMIEYAFETTGQSRLSASGKKPLDLSSGKALNSLSGIEHDRQSVPFTLFSNFITEVARILVDKMGEKNPELKIDEDEKIKIKEYQVALLGEHPQTRLANVVYLASQGLIAKNKLLQLLEHPDLESYTEMLNVEDDAIRVMFNRNLRNFKDKDEYIGYDPNITLPSQKLVAREKYLNAVKEDDPISERYFDKLIKEIQSAEFQIMEAAEQMEMDRAIEQQEAIQASQPAEISPNGNPIPQGQAPIV